MPIDAVRLLVVACTAQGQQVVGLPGPAAAHRNHMIDFEMLAGPAALAGEAVPRKNPGTP
jgi:hypothetical protein